MGNWVIEVIKALAIFTEGGKMEVSMVNENYLS